MELPYTDLKPPSQGKADENDYTDLRKKLFSCDMEYETSFSAPSRKEPVLIYLRVRPKSQMEIESLDPECLHQTSDHELIAVPPKSSNTFKNVRRGIVKHHKFFFSHIFSPSTAQKDLFKETLKPRLKDFFEGQNCLVFTYGVTNSGKSYTITGTPSEPGLLPRALDVIFNSLNLKRMDEVRIVPERFGDLRFVSDQELVEKQEWKDNILSMARDVKVCSPSNNISEDEQSNHSVDITSMDVTSMDVTSMDITSSYNLSKISSNSTQLTDSHITDLNFMDFIQVHDEESSLDFVSRNECQFVLYVSFAEIYNELIYDLLEEDPRKGKRRVALKIAQDKNKNYYIKGLQEVPVCSVEEAMLVMQLGLRHRHVASTRLNYNSSRSHSIYSIKLVKLASGAHKPTTAIISRFSIVDLAGAERSRKTGATGMRMKEAGSINNSLLVLGKCINAMKSNQSKRYVEEHLAPPFRESKLTCLFQNYLIGKGTEGMRQGKVTMFVNISNNASVFDETFHVLKFSALTGKVIPITKCIARPHLSVVTRENATSAPYDTTSAPYGTTCAPYDTTSAPYDTTSAPSDTTSAPYDTTSASYDTTSAPSDTTSASYDTTSAPSDTTSVTSLSTTLDCPNCQAMCKELHACRHAHQQALVQLHNEKIELEWSIRQEICQEFTEKLTDVEDEHCRDLEEQEKDYKDMMESRLNIIQKSVKNKKSRKRRRNESSDDENEVSLQQRVSQLETRNRELEEELAMEKTRGDDENEVSLQQRVSQLETRNRELEEELAMEKTRGDDENEVSSQLETRNRELEEELAMEKTRGDDENEVSLQQRVSQLETRNRELEEELAMEKTRGDDENEVSSQLETRNRELEEELAMEKTRGDDENEVSLQQRVSQLETRNRELEEELAMEKTRGDDENEVSSQLETRNRELEEELAMEKTRGDDENEVSLQQRVSQLETRNRELEEELAMEKTRGDDENEVSLQQRVSQLETRNRGLEEELAMEKTRGDDENEVSSQLETRNRELEEELAMEKTKGDDENEVSLQQSVSQLETRNRELEEELAMEKTRGASLVCKNEEMKSLRESWNKQLQELLKDKKHSMELISELDSARSVLSARVRDLERECEKNLDDEIKSLKESLKVNDAVANEHEKKCDDEVPSELFSTDATIYETVLDDTTISSVTQPVLKSIENSFGSSLGMDCSELCMPVLEQSFQPMIDTVLQNTENMEMGPTPRPVKKKQKRKQDIQASGKNRYLLRNRNHTPAMPTSVSIKSPMPTSVSIKSPMPTSVSIKPAMPTSVSTKFATPSNVLEQWPFFEDNFTLTNVKSSKRLTARQKNASQMKKLHLEVLPLQVTESPMRKDTAVRGNIMLGAKLRGITRHYEDY